MPNIKIYGLNKLSADLVYSKIKRVFENESYAQHIVVTIVDSKVKDLKEISQPYLQLEIDCMKNYEQKLEKLKQIGMDIQVVELHEFIPKN
ncbi:hypothetical protein K9M48_03425 [Candidatus Gracilibacteria bacterium]|nr:hypothetical protein [Candidatus Gracilibacteria bacterium]